MSGAAPRRVIIVGADVGADDRVDVVWRDGVIESMAPAGTTRPQVDDEVINAAGGGLLPGLHDHHLHLGALAAARSSARGGPPEVTTRHELAAALAAAAARAGAGGWVRAVGYHESVAGDLDAAGLDALAPAVAAVPVRVQHRSGQRWIFNTAALEAAAVAELADPGVERDRHGTPTGRLDGVDHLVRDRVSAPVPDVAAVGAELASYGVTGVTDATPYAGVEDLALVRAAVTDPAFPVRVTFTGGPALERSTAPELRWGPVKILPREDELGDLDALVARFAAARATGRPMAVHCVTRVGLVVALAAWDQVGVRPGDRIEHGAVLPTELIDEVARRGLTVITQPNLVAERGDGYRVEVDAVDRPHLWRCRSLLDAGVKVAAGTDAPFGHPDPWRAMAAAIGRRTRAGALLGADERVESAAALDLFLGAPDDPAGDRRRVSAGLRTDLCLLAVPLAAAVRSPAADHVAATVGPAGITWA